MAAKKDNQKLFIIRKYIMASNAKQAIIKDKSTPVDDVYIDENWKNGSNKQLSSAIGFDNGHHTD